MKEIFRPVVGFEGIYEVSNIGTVRSLGRHVTECNGRTRMVPARNLRLNKNSDGYMDCLFCVNHKKTKLKLARVIWEAFMGEIPNGFLVDHKDRVRDNNALSNLRLATRQQNNVNRIGCPTKTSKYKGVVKYKNRFRAQITHNYKVTYLGTFDSEIEASKAYNKTAKKLHGEFFTPWVCNNHVAIK